MSTATVTSKGQITIPVEVRRRLGLESGDRVEFVEVEGGFAIKPLTDDENSLKGLLRKPAKTVSISDDEYHHQGTRRRWPTRCVISGLSSSLARPA